MAGHEGSSVSSYLVDPTSSIPSHCASIVVTSTLRVNFRKQLTFRYIDCKVKGTWWNAFAVFQAYLRLVYFI